jgi:hypothetical protein
MNSSCWLSGRQPGKLARKALLAERKADHQRRQVLGLRGIEQARRVLGVAQRELRATEAVEDHHRALDAGGAELVERVRRRGEGFALVHPFQHFVIARLGADVGDRQAGGGQFAQLLDRLPAQVARQAVARYPAHRRQVSCGWREDIEQATRRQHQRIAVGQEDAPDLAAEAFAGEADAFQHLGLVAGPKMLLRRGIHLAERAVIPRAAVGHRQDQRLSASLGGR